MLELFSTLTNLNLFIYLVYHFTFILYKYYNNRVFQGKIFAYNHGKMKKYIIFAVINYMELSYGIELRL